MKFYEISHSLKKSWNLMKLYTAWRNHEMYNGFQVSKNVMGFETA